jgi:hypothetical protein
MIREDWTVRFMSHMVTRARGRGTGPRAKLVWQMVVLGDGSGPASLAKPHHRTRYGVNLTVITSPSATT